MTQRDFTAFLFVAGLVLAGVADLADIPWLVLPAMALGAWGASRVKFR